MAEGTITLQTINRSTGTVVTYAAATAGGDKFPNDGKTVLRVKNSDSSPHSVTVNSVENCDQGFDHDEPSSVAVANGGVIREFGPFPMALYNDADGYAHVTYTAVTSVTVAAVQLPSG
jgi:hypothetical protein